MLAKCRYTAYGFDNLVIRSFAVLVDFGLLRVGQTSSNERCVLSSTVDIVL